ncbi:MAG: hypothetical protein II263_10180 [Lachnospiraceae bacterium]|nr:hypothetical protein [Lachnospiraceae bacterium]
MELKSGWQARVLAGNDRGKTYVIKEDCGEYAFLIRGDGKVLRKNKKHIQVIKRTRQ